MSTASPLPLQPLPPSTISDAEARALKQQVASRLADHRQRRSRTAVQQPALPLEGMNAPRRSRVADSVAARFAQSVSYREFLQQEAETALRQAEAAAEIAMRNAEAIAAAQQQLLQEIDQWNGVHDAPEAHHGATAEILHFTPAPSAEAPAVVAAELAVVHEPAFVDPQIAADSVISAEAICEPEEIALPAEPLEPATPLPANLIEFPRQLVAARRARPRHAEGPLREEADASPERAQLRIFEVEASSITTTPVIESSLPDWHDIRLDAQATPRTAESADAQISFALPLYVAPSSARVMAAMVDACCIATSFLAAVAAAVYASPSLPTGIPAAAAAGGSLALFCVLYQLLFFSFSNATPGMRYARIGLCTFSDENPTRAARQRRILALLLAMVPLGLGLLWVTLDEEGLGWHDRISRMYPRAY